MISRRAQDAPRPLSRALGEESGFSLMEAIVALAISMIAILALAHTFGVGRGFIERFAIGRTALGVARARMEYLSVLPASSESLAVGNVFSQPFNYRGLQTGTVEWRIVAYNDPQVTPTNDLREVTVVASWGPVQQRDSLRLTRLFPMP